MDPQHGPPPRQLWVPRAASSLGGACAPSAAGGSRYAERTWEEDGGFDGARTVTVGTTRFRVYGTAGPSSAAPRERAAVCLVCIHGAGYTGLSWAAFARELKGDAGFRVLAPDLRGHGATGSGGESYFGQVPDLSASQLVQDVADVVRALAEEDAAGPAHPAVNLKGVREVVLVGHSMGGAVVARLARAWPLGDKIKLAGCAVVDVVEGSAMAGLPTMKALLSKRPVTFPSASAAVEWAVTSGMSRNTQAARVSIPSQLAPVDKSRPEHPARRWRTDLSATEPHWRGWFEGLSETFISCPAAKLLLLAGTDRLDTVLTRAQMMGKFQMVILPEVGHAIQEDDPHGTAMAVKGFVERMVLPPPGLAKILAEKAERQRRHEAARQ